MLASPTHRRFEQVSDVRLVHVDGVVRWLHVVPPSNVASRSRVFESLVALTMHVSAFVHVRSVTVSLEDQGRGALEDQVAPSLVEKVIVEAVFTPSVITAAHDDAPKQLRVRIPCPPASDPSATTDWEEAL